MENKKTALIIVDIENDFVPGGALSVNDGDKVIPIINKIQNKFDVVVATKDWHPKDHDSFAEKHHKKPGEVILIDGFEQILWPTHCVQNTWGSEFVKEFDQSKLSKVFYKGTDPHVDSYSAFYDNEKKLGTGLDKYLADQGIKEIYIAGLTTEYCVTYSVLDALSLGFKVSVIIDACKPVNLKFDDEKKAIEKMKSAGAQIITSSQL